MDIETKIELAAKLAENEQIDSPLCIALAVYLDGNTDPRGDIECLNTLVRLTYRIARNDNAMSDTRFSLYDYMDALVNEPPSMPDILNRAADTTDDEELSELLIRAASLKRASYSEN